MDWTAPYLIVVLAALAIVELWFASALVVLGRRYRAKRRNVSGRGPLLRVAELSSEELGLLAGGEQRWSEVALLRLCLEGHVKEDGLIVLVDDPGSANPEHGPRTVRDAILERLRGRRPAHLQDVVHAGRKYGESSVPYGRLAKLGLVDDGAVGVARTRQRIMNWYLGLFTTTFIVAVICLSLAATDVRAAVAIGIGLMAVCMAVAALMSRISGARFEVITGDGRELLTRAALEQPEPADDRLLHRVALQGLNIIPEFAQAADRGNPDAGMSTGQQGFHAATGLFSALFGLLPGSGGSSDGTKK
jgi:uncharacterized protein (TIGR04222 family)